jgi:hypothetical protein
VELSSCWEQSRGRCRSSRDLHRAIEIGGEDLTCDPVRAPEATVVPAGGLAHGDAGQEGRDVTLFLAHAQGDLRRARNSSRLERLSPNAR